MANTVTLKVVTKIKGEIIRAAGMESALERFRELAVVRFLPRKLYT